MRKNQGFTSIDACVVVPLGKWRGKFLSIFLSVMNSAITPAKKNHEEKKTLALPNIEKRKIALVHVKHALCDLQEKQTQSLFSTRVFIFPHSLCLSLSLSVFLSLWSFEPSKSHRYIFIIIVVIITMNESRDVMIMICPYKHNAPTEIKP